PTASSRLAAILSALFTAPPNYGIAGSWTKTQSDLYRAVADPASGHRIFTGAGKFSRVRSGGVLAGGPERCQGSRHAGGPYMVVINESRDLHALMHPACTNGRGIRFP